MCVPTLKESVVLTNLIECKDIVTQKANKGNTVVITDRTKYLEGIKSLLSDSSKFIWLNCIINLENKLKDCLKVLKNEETISEKEFDNICPVGTTPDILYGNPKVHEQSLTTLRNFELIYQQ